MVPCHEQGSQKGGSRKQSPGGKRKETTALGAKIFLLFVRKSHWREGQEGK